MSTEISRYAGCLDPPGPLSTEGPSPFTFRGV